MRIALVKDAEGYITGVRKNRDENAPNMPEKKSIYEILDNEYHGLINFLYGRKVKTTTKSKAEIFFGTNLFLRSYSDQEMAMEDDEEFVDKL